MALTRGADHTREDLLGPCAAGRPIPATDLALDDGGADGVFSAPVGRVDVGGPQEGEHSRELAVEMPGEALGRRQSGRRVDEPAQAGKQAPAGPSEALLGDRVGIPPIAEREGVGEDGLHAGCPRAPRMVGTGVGARMRAGLRASNRRARHLPMRYETGLPSSVIRFRT